MLPNCHYNIPITILDVNIIITESASTSYCYALDAWPVFQVIVKLCFACYVLCFEQLIYLNNKDYYFNIYRDMVTLSYTNGLVDQSMKVGRPRCGVKVGRPRCGG